jgi:hypothetical protein
MSPSISSAQLIFLASLLSQRMFTRNHLRDAGRLTLTLLIKASTLFAHLHGGDFPPRDANLHPGGVHLPTDAAHLFDQPQIRPLDDSRSNYFSVEEIYAALQIADPSVEERRSARRIYCRRWLFRTNDEEVVVE